MTIRTAEESDAESIAAIYAHHVLNGTATYDVEPPSIDQIRSKIRHVTGEAWPFILAEAGGVVAGYAYATQFRDRPAYRFTAEDSIYVHPEMTGRGVGKTLLRALIDRSMACGFRTLIAVIGGAEPASIAVHASCGFREVGRLRRVGFKFDRWLDSLYMQLELPNAGAQSGV